MLFAAGGPWQLGPGKPGSWTAHLAASGRSPYGTCTVRVASPSSNDTFRMHATVPVPIFSV